MLPFEYRWPFASPASISSRAALSWALESRSPRLWRVPRFNGLHLVAVRIFRGAVAEPTPTRSNHVASPEGGAMLTLLLSRRT